MSAWAPFKIICDWPDCYARSQTSYTKITEARKYTARHGWLHVAGMDLCGKPEQAEEYAEDARSWRGCAAKKEHLPATKNAGRGEVYLTCACGWIPQPRYGWDRAGIVARTSADFRWREHVKEIITEAGER